MRIITYPQMLLTARKYLAFNDDEKTGIVLAGAVCFSFILLLNSDQIRKLNRGVFSGPYDHQGCHIRHNKQISTSVTSNTVHTAEMICYLNNHEKWPLHKYTSRRCLDFLRKTGPRYEFYCEDEYVAPWQNYHKKIIDLFGDNPNDPLFPNKKGERYSVSTLRSKLKKYTDLTWSDFRLSGLFYYYKRLQIQKYEPQNAIATLAKLTKLKESYLIKLFNEHDGA